MPRSRPASKPLSFHKATGHHYVTRAGRRLYLGADRKQALQKYHRLALGIPSPTQPPARTPIACKELANRFLAAQQANWRVRKTTLRCYRDWSRHFLEDHEGLLAEELTVEMFAGWRLSSQHRGYSAESINHYLSAARAMYAFAGKFRTAAETLHGAVRGLVAFRAQGLVQFHNRSPPGCAYYALKDRGGKHFEITRLTTLKSWCADPIAAGRFALHLAERSKGRATKKYKPLIANALRQLKKHLANPGDQAPEPLWQALRELEDSQNETRSSRWGLVRTIHCREALLAEHALRCVARSRESAH